MRRITKSPSDKATFLVGIDMLVQNIDLVAIEARNFVFSIPPDLKGHDHVTTLLWSLEKHLSEAYEQADQIAQHLRTLYAEQGIEYMEIPDKRR